MIKKEAVGFKKGCAQDEQDLRCEHLDEIEDLKVLIECLKQQLTEKIAQIKLEQQRHRIITAKEKIECFRSGYFRATRDLKREPLSDTAIAHTKNVNVKNGQDY